MSLSLALSWLACAPEPPPPPPVEPEPAVEPTEWELFRDPVSRISVHVPAKLTSAEKTRKVGEVDTVWFEQSGRSYGALRSELTLAWAPRDPALEDPMGALSLLAHAPEDATVTTISGLEALRWETDDALAHHTRVVAVAEDRLYWVRFLDNEDARRSDAHDKVFGSLRFLGAVDLTDAERSATGAALEDREARLATEAAREAAEARKQADIAAGIRPPDAEIVKAEALRQMGLISCMVPSNESGAALLKFSVRDGRVSSMRVYEQPQGWSNRPTKPRERKDMLAMCIAGEAARWTFSPELQAANLEIPMTFY
ncbi:MAG: hypothetical protein R3F61_04435 [Myxococcota bacterium]